EARTTLTNRKTPATKSAKTTTHETKATTSRAEQQLMRFLPGGIIILAVLVALLPHVLAATYGAAGQELNTIPSSLSVAGISSVSTVGGIAPLFTAAVQDWANGIDRKRVVEGVGG